MSKAYMFGNKDALSQRRQRENQQVELRRQRTEELLKKKRDSSVSRTAEASFEALHSRLQAEDIETLYRASYECRSALSVENNPPIQAVIDAGLVPRVVELLGSETYAGYITANPEIIRKIRTEAAWIVTNIASGTNEQTAQLVREGAVPRLVEMLGERDDSLVDQSVWALGNMAGDCEAVRDVILGQNALFQILALVEQYSVAKEHIKILRNLTWLMANLCRGRNPPPPVEVMAPIKNAVEKLVMLQDQDVVSDCFWCLSYIADVGSNLASTVASSPALGRCKEILTSFVAKLNGAVDQPSYDSALAKIGAYAICPIIRMLGNIVTGTDDATDTIIHNGFLRFLNPIFYRFENQKITRIRKEICWLISNVTAGTPAQVSAVLDSDLVPLLVDSLSHYELYIRKEASYAILNILHFCINNSHCLQQLLDCQVLQAMQSYFSAISNVPELQAQILDATRYALEAGNAVRARTGENPVVQAMISMGFADEIEELQDSRNSTVYQKAYNIMMDYFEGEDELF